LTTLNQYFDNHPLVTKRADGLYCQKNLSFDIFEQQYVELRQKEKRLHTDEETFQLPFVRTDHPHRAEWEIRKRSMKKLTSYLKKRPIHKLLEVGCGNGWLTHHLSVNVEGCVCGVDVNEVELAQAARVFSDNKIAFLHGDIFEDLLPCGYFDIIVLASSVQYFSDFPKLIKRVFELGARKAEVHIVDSPFYVQDEIESARKRTENYFAQIGFPTMAQNYFHRTMLDLNHFKWKYLYNPDSLQNRVLKKIGKASPFPWILIEST